MNGDPCPAWDDVRKVWRAMIARCANPRSSSWPRYGARGITVCDRWLNSYEAFRDDMGPRPGPDYSIDRINNDGPYAPDNCRWATREQQAANKRDPNKVKTHCPQGHPYSGENLYEHGGERHCIACSREHTRRWRDKQRGGPAAPYGAAKTHCVNGHEFTPENTGRKSNGGRRCKTCDRDRARAAAAS